MCAKQTDPHVKKLDRPDRESNQVKMVLPVEASLIYARQPKRSTTTMATHGRPYLSIFAKHPGPIPFWQRAWIVRVEANVQELATEITLTVITALKIDGSALIPASWNDSTKGE